MVAMRATLHIEHPVRDFDAWKRVFDGFHDFRVEHGVRSVRVGRGLDADSGVAIDLVFDSADAAATFLRALRERVWIRQQATDLLTAAPSALILNLVEDTTISPRARTTPRCCAIRNL
jgi:hypothetical protein